MRWFGIGLIIIGASLLLFIGYRFFKNEELTLSPLPDEKGVRVILITPSVK